MTSLKSLAKVGLVLGAVVGVLTALLLTQGLEQYGILKIAGTWLLATALITISLLVIVRKLWPSK